MPTRQEFNDKYQPYWDAPTARVGLHQYYRSQISGDTRVCVVCEEEKDLEEFWDGFKYSYACHDDRGKLRGNRKRLERKVAKENREMSKKGPVGGAKEKIGSQMKKAGIKMAGKALEKAVT
jgi:hypothetical protein